MNRPGTPNISPATVTTEPPAFSTLRQLQAQIASSLENLKPISNENVLLLAQSAKEYQREVLTSVHHAQSIAQQALLSAQESVTACQDCLKAAESTQVQIDEVMAAVESIGGGGHASGWNVALEALRSDFRQLQAWVRDLEVHEVQRQREFKEAEVKSRSQEQTLQLQGPSAIRLGNSLTPHPAHPNNIQTRSPVAPPKLLLSSPILNSVEHEADAAARAWDQLREQSAERRKPGEAELRKRRDAEERLEEEQKQAQVLVEAREVELARLRAERIEAEQREKVRQTKEAEEAEQKRKELHRVREEAIRFQLGQRKAGEQRSAAEENAHQTKDTEAKRLAEEQKRRDVQAREPLAMPQEERAKAVVAEAQRQHLLQEQEFRKQELHAPKYRASPGTAKKLHAELTNGNQANGASSIEKSITSSHQNTLPLGGQTTVAANFLKPSLGNTSTTPTCGGPGGIKNTGAQANFPSSDTSASRPFTTSPKVGHVDLQSLNLLSDLIPPITILQATDPNSSTQPRYITPVQRHQSTSANSITYSSNGSINRLELNSWVTPPATPRSAPNTQASVCIDSDIGNVPLIPRSLVPPISPEVQKVNLRRLIVANGSSISPNIKRDSNGEQLVIKQENLALPLRVEEPTNGPSTTTTSNLSVGSQPKVESHTDIPLLSLPSPSSLTQGDTLASSTSPVLDSEQGRARPPNSTGQQQPGSSDLVVGNAQQPIQLHTESITTTSTAVDTSRTSSTEEQRATVVSGATSKPNVSSLPRPPLPMVTFSSVSHSLTPNDPFDNLLASRMGPDASTLTNGWSPPSPIQEDATDLRYRVRASRPPPGPDHYPLAPPAANTRGPPPRSRPPRRVDHYSPSRGSLERLPPVHNDDPRTLSQSGGSASSNPLRCISPDSRAHLMGRPDNGPLDISPPNLLGRKRQRVGEQPLGPPSRRPRYSTDNEQAPLIGTARRVTSTAAERGQPTNYERSPTAESRVTLFDRIEDRGPSSISTAFRGGQASNSYQPDSQNHQRPAGSNFAQRVSQGQPPYGNNPYSNSQRPNYRNPEDSSRPLLHRFTDSTHPSQADSGYPPPRSYRPRPTKTFGRGGAHPPLEQRLSNNPNNPSLINRMQGPTDFNNA